MRVAILARGMRRVGGVGRLLNGYVRHLPLVSPGDEFFVITDSPLPDQWRAPNLKEIVLARANPAIFDHIEVPQAVKRITPDVFLAMKNSVPVGLRCPVVCTFLDLAYFAMADAYPVIDNLYMRAMFKHSARLACRIVAISRSTRDDVGRFLGRQAYEKTRIVHPGVSDVFRPLDEHDRREARKRLPGLPERFVLYAGNISPRKNIPRLLEAASTAAPDVGLVLTGHRIWKARNFRRLVKTASKRRAIKVLGTLPDEDLVALYSLAEASVYPSLYEGFGFPVLESFACGAPVAASNATAIPEVAGDAAVLFDPTDVAAMSEAIGRLLRDSTLRAELREKGLKRAAEFTWRRSSEGLLEVLREVA